MRGTTEKFNLGLRYPLGEITTREKYVKNNKSGKWHWPLTTVFQNQNRTNTDARAKIIDQVHWYIKEKLSLSLTATNLTNVSEILLLKPLTSVYRVCHEVTIPKVHKH